MKLGTVVHEAIKEFLDKHSPEDYADLYEEYENNGYKIPYLQDSNLPYTHRLRARVMFLNAVKFMMNGKLHPSYLEIFCKRPDIKVEGVIDLIDAKKMIVVDWKTSKDAKMTADYSLQGNIYAMLSREIVGKVITDVRFVFLESGEPIKCTVNSDTINSTVAFIKQVRDDITKCSQQGLFPRVKSSKCQKCQFALTCRRREIEEQES